MIYIDTTDPMITYFLIAFAIIGLIIAILCIWGIIHLMIKDKKDKDERRKQEKID